MLGVLGPSHGIPQLFLRGSYLREHGARSRTWFGTNTRHAVNFLLYFAHGAPLGMTNEALDDGMADAFSALVGDDCIIGDGFFGPGTFLRTACNTNHWPEDDNPDPQTAGTILSGAFWDLRLLAGMPTAEHVHHFAKYGLPDDPDNGIAFNEMFLECLIADDNDGQLVERDTALQFDRHRLQQPRHRDQLLGARRPHAARRPANVGAVPDQPRRCSTRAPLAGSGPVTLFYSINGSAFESRPMLPTGNPDEYGAEITATSYGIVKYYIRAQDVYGGTRVEPAGAPTRDIHAFVAGPSTTAISLDMETNPNWVVGATDDLAATGVWVRADPYGTIAQPEDDHSVLGTQCWVTGNNPSPDPGLDDVDGGKTTLTTNAFNATVDALLHPIISYWRWYSNNTGDAPGLDTWRVDISSNGGTTWVPIEATTASSTMGGSAPCS